MLLPSQRSEEQTKHAYKMLSDCLRFGMKTSCCRAKILVEYFDEDFSKGKCATKWNKSVRRLSHLELVWISIRRGIRSKCKKPVRELNYLKELVEIHMHVLSIFDEEAQAVASVHRSSRLLEESFATGVVVLSKYSEQRDHLKLY